MRNLDLQEAMDEAVRTDPTTFYTLEGEVFDRSTTISASAIGRCARAIAFERGGFPEDPGTTVPYGIFDRGHAVEHQVEKRLRQALQANGLELNYAGEAQRTLVHGQLSATPDGLISNRGGESIVIPTSGIPVRLDPGASCVVEFKSVDPRTNISEPKPEQVKQVEVQIELFNVCTNYAPQCGIIIQTDTADHSRRAFHHIERAADGLQQMQARAAQIFDCKDPADMRAEGRYTGACQYCKYTVVCGQAVKRYFPEDEKIIEGEEAQVLDELCSQLDMCKDDAKALAADVKEQEEIIKEHLVARGYKKATTETYRVLYSEVAGRKRFNIKELENEFPDIAERPELWNEGTTTTRLTITRKG